MASKIPSCLILLSILIISSSFETAVAGGIAVYWGETGLESNLTETCATGNYAIVIIAFHPIFGNASKRTTNLATHHDPRYDHHHRLSNEILLCQSRGIKVLISIDGGKYSLSSSKDAKHKAKYLWDNYLGGNSSSRPLGPAVLDGVDFAFEAGKADHWGELAKHLAMYKGWKKVYLSAAPRCPFLDSSTMSALETGVFDYVWVQFYHNPRCHFPKGNATTLNHFWQWWTTKVPARNFFLGLPAAREAGTYGFMSPSTLTSRVLPIIKSAKKYGGVMLWSRYYDQITKYSSSIVSYV